MSRNAFFTLAFFLGAIASSAYAIPAATEGRPFNQNDRLVVAYVFAWYTPTMGQTRGVWHPLEGRPKWDGTVDFWKRQVKDMMDANVDLIYVHLINKFRTERANLYTALRDLRLEGYRVPQIAPWLDPNITFRPANLGLIDLCVATDRALFIEQYVDFYQTYLAIDPDGESFFATMDGKPMLNMWSGKAPEPGPDYVSNLHCLPRVSSPARK